MSNNVFVYGTLMLPEVVEALTGRLFAPEKAILNGYSNYGFKSKCYPGIVEDNGGIVEGALYSDIDNYTLSIFDWYEEVLYERHLLTVQSKAKKIQAFVYVVSQQHRYKLDAVSWTLENFIKKYAETYVQKCLGYRKEWQKINISLN